MRDYGRIYSRFWTSSDMQALSDDGRMLALYLLSGPHGTIAGVCRLPYGYICEDIKWTSQRVSKGFHELFTNGFANRCETTKWVWIRKFLEWNTPENPNQWKSARKIAESVPADCTFRSEFIGIFNQALGTNVEPLSNPSETVTEPLPTQEQYQKQEQDIGNPSPKKRSKSAKTRLPEDFLLDPELEAYAEKHLPGVDPPELLESFKRKAIAGEWQYANWRMALQEFIRNAAPHSGHWAAGQYPKKAEGAPVCWPNGNKVQWQ